jgi:hypothetical protein
MAYAETILWIASLYGLAGLAFAIAFVTLGVARVDPAAAGAPIGFRFLILPGSLALWPVLLSRWMRATRRRP